MQTYNDMLNILANRMAAWLFGLNWKNNFLFLYAYKSKAKMNIFVVGMCLLKFYLFMNGAGFQPCWWVAAGKNSGNLYDMERFQD